MSARDQTESVARRSASSCSTARGACCIQREAARRGGLPRRALPRPPARRRRRPRPAQPDAPGRRARHPPRLPRRRRRHHDHEHLHGDPIGQADYGLEAAVRRDERRGRAARPAGGATRSAAGFVAGSVGPLNVTLSLSPARRRPRLTARVTFDQVVAAYAEQIRALAEGGVDLLLIETIFDTLNAKAAIAAAREAAPELPLWISVTDRRPQRPDALRPDRRGVLDRRSSTPSRSSSASTARSARRRCARTSRSSPASPTRTSPATRTPGLPNAFGGYDEQPARHEPLLARVRARPGSSTSSAAAAARRPSTSRAIAAAVAGSRRRDRSRARPHRPRFSGLEPFEIGPDTGFVMIGERTNVTGSARFRRLIEADDYQGAVDVALEQVRGGANLLDVNMDADLLDSEQAMTTFLNLIATEPEVARIPIMVDSSRCSVLEAGPQVRAGQGHRQLDQPQGGRGAVPRAGAHDPRLRRGRRRDGVRRAGPGRHRRAQGGDLRPRLRPAHRRPASRPRTSSSTRTCSPSRPGSRSTTATPRRSSRRCR